MHLWRTWRRDFRKSSNTDAFYDLIGDYELIEASFAQQYGIRLRLENTMSWSEFTTLLAGLNGDTPLGNVVRIRSEKDPKMLKQFTPEQKRIRAEWRRKQSAEMAKHFSRDEYDNAMKNLSAMFRTMARME